MKITIRTKQVDVKGIEFEREELRTLSSIMLVTLNRQTGNSDWVDECKLCDEVIRAINAIEKSEEENA